MKIKGYMAIGFCLVLGFAAYVFSSSSASELDAALTNYSAWKEIHVSSVVNGRVTSHRSDGEYQQLFKSFKDAGKANFVETKQWLEKNDATVPAPIFWNMAVLSLNNNQPIEDAAKWLGIGQVTGRYDASKCSDKSASGAFFNTIMENAPLLKVMSEHPVEYKNGLQAALAYLKTTHYHPSPMWICSLGMSSFQTQGGPKAYHDLVLPPEKQPYTWQAFLTKVEQSIKEKPAS